MNYFFLILLISTFNFVTCKEFHLRHVFHNSGGLVKRNDPPLSKRSNPRLKFNINPKATTYLNTLNFLPNPKDRETILSLAQMSTNGYYDPSEKDKWIKVAGNWSNPSDSTQFGWERDGIRGYIFVDDENEVMVITLKGTSPRYPGSGVTSPRDKLNDNMMFSCCCGYVDYTWSPVCNCNRKNNQCDVNCLLKNDSYYNLAQTIYVAVRGMYPYSSIWLTGHSLGGSIASLVALTNQIPAVTFEAPGDLMYAERLGLLPNLPLPIAPTYQKDREKLDEFLETLPIYHFGNNGDPIFLGLCTGSSSTCYWGGYAMESKCHTGKVCTYIEHQNNKHLGVASLDVRNHGIPEPVVRFITEMDVPECVVQKGCRDCESWNYF